MKTEINVLHLSDIHFGYETKQEITLIGQRKNVLNALIDRLKQIEPKWKPDIVVISGDIGWKGITENYKPAKEWITSLLQILNLSSRELLICPGNHDIDRNKTVGMDYTDSPTKADSWLKIENLEHFERLFNSFNEFCREISLPLLKIADKESYLVGVRELLGLRFVVLNSAWFCRGDEDKNKLWIGLPQLELMNAKNQLLNETNYDNENILLAITHHPDSWLNDNETNSYGGRTNTYNYLAERSHIILSGHVHGEIKRPNRMSNRAYLFTAGATYANKNYRNNFSILKIETKNRILTRKSYEYNPSCTNWNEISNPENYYLRKDESSIKSVNSLKDGYDYKNLKIKSKAQIQRFIENKSKAIARTRKLPELIERKIVWHNQEERIIPDGKGKIQLNTKTNISTLSEMVSTERPTFVFGELGSGKSTLVGQYLINLAENLNGILPLLIPASFFNGKEIKLVTDLERLINEFVNGQIIPTYKDFEIFEALKQKIEITLIIDGFDELSRIEAQNLLTKAEELRDNWAGLRIIATGRPIELAGINYSNWQCLEMFPITNSELKEILLNEAIADGLDNDQAMEDSEKRIHFLNERPELLGVTTTPLSIRLIRPFLTEEIKRKSLGDLIYDIIRERLGAWDVKDSKETHFDEFKKFYPNPSTREALLGVIAREIIESNNRTVTEEQLNIVLKNVTPKESNQNIIVEQAVNFFEKCILQKEIDHFVFPSQPILQGALGIYIYEQLLNAKVVNFKVGKTDLWREYSFAATMARRENNIKTIRSGLIKFIDDIFLDENFIPAIAIIVSEAEDEELAKHFIELLKNLDFRPLRYFQDIKTQSVRAIAHSIYLAGDLGFDWFYEEYLNPIYPSGLHYDDEQYLILQHWFTFCNYKLTSKQQVQLTLILNPHLMAIDWACHKLPETLVMVLPQLFQQDKEFLLYVANIESTLFGSIVVNKLKDEFRKGNSEKVLNALLNYIARSENPKLSVIKLWFELTDKFPPKEIIKSTILKSIDENNLEVFEELIKRIGRDNLKSVLRFYLFLDSKIAAASAICLYRLGERDFYPLANGLLQGLHDGGRIQGAEKVLHELISNKGINGLTWLANKFYDCDGMTGAHSAYWRILITELNKINQVDENIFAKAVVNLGEFILPRYPEIRVELKKLLTSKADYRNFLNRSLRSINKKIRYNSACILFACFPESEVKACEIIINSITVYYEKHEWWHFCLRLSLGREVIANTASVINKLLPIPRTFALTLLYHNNFSLSAELFEQLIFGLLSSRARFDADYSLQSDNLKKILAQNESWELLNKYLHNSNIDIARNAADALLLYHKEKLSDCEYGISWGLSIAEMFTWKKERIDKEIIQLKQNEERFNNIKKILDKTHKETNQEPLASLYFRAVEDEKVWKDILWSSLALDKYMDHNIIANSCMWLFTKAKKNPQIAKVIGEAAVEFLDHPSLNGDRLYNDVMPWLTFLANEFGTIKKEKIESVLVNFKPIGKEITSALIARLGYTPVNYHPQRNSALYLIFSDYLLKPLGELAFQKIIEVTRDSETIHVDLIDWLEETLLTNALSLKELEELSVKSKFGLVFSIIVLFSRGNFNKTEWLVKILGLSLTRFGDSNRSAKYVQTSMREIISSIEEVKELNDEFYSNIKKTIDSKNHGEIIELYKALLKKKDLFELSYLTDLLSEISESYYKLDLDLARNLVGYFLEVDSLQIPKVLSEVKKIIVAINEKVDKYDLEFRFEGLNKLLFSLTVFYFQKEVDDESCNVFLDGLEYVFINFFAPINVRDNNKRRLRGGEIMNVISPLLERINPSLIKECIMRGAASEKPELSSLCNLLVSLR